MAKSQCIAVLRSGKRCGRIGDWGLSGMCYNHDPDAIRQQKESRQESERLRQEFEAEQATLRRTKEIESENKELRLKLQEYEEPPRTTRYERDVLQALQWTVGGHLKTVNINLKQTGASLDWEQELASAGFYRHSVIPENEEQAQISFTVYKSRSPDAEYRWLVDVWDFESGLVAFVCSSDLAYVDLLRHMAPLLMMCMTADILRDLNSVLEKLQDR